MYPSNYRNELVSSRRERRAFLIASHLLVAAISMLAALSLIVSVAGN